MKRAMLDNFEKDYLKYSKSFKKIVDFIKHNQNIISFISINQLAKETETSAATVTRFSKSLGFKGYPEFQKIFQQDVESSSSQMRDFRDEVKLIGSDNILVKTLATNIELLEEIDVELIEKKLNDAIEIINKGKKLYILGARGSYAIAYYLYFMLKELREDVELIVSGSSDFTDKLLYSTVDDVLFAISFHPYTNFTCQITEFFKEQRSKVISMTDKIDSTLGSLSNLVINTKNGVKAHSFIPAIAILNAMVLKFAKLNEDSNIKKLDRVKQITDRFEIYQKN